MASLCLKQQRVDYREVFRVRSHIAIAATLIMCELHDFAISRSRKFKFEVQRLADVVTHAGKWFTKNEFDCFTVENGDVDDWDFVAGQQRVFLNRRRLEHVESGWMDCLISLNLLHKINFKAQKTILSNFGHSSRISIANVHIFHSKDSLGALSVWYLIYR